MVWLLVVVGAAVVGRNMAAAPCLILFKRLEKGVVLTIKFIVRVDKISKVATVGKL